MAGCTVENWTLEDLASALQNMHKDNKKISVPVFQRGKRWNKDQEKTFIDSLIRGYPVGTMLFYETLDNGVTTYILVDGLQRGNSIRKYMNNPTEFFYDSSISNEMCRKILECVNSEENAETRGIVRDVLTDFIKGAKTYKNLQYFSVAKAIADKFGAGIDAFEPLINIIAEFFMDRQALYDQIASSVIPVIVYHGSEDNLPSIFDRINSKGTPLDAYEVYAASWPVNKKFKVNNPDIISSASKKYDAFIADGYEIYGYNPIQLIRDKELSAFEYLFGLGKYLVAKYPILAFNKSLADDTVNPIAFELVNAVLNDSKDKIKELYKSIYDLDVNSFELALFQAIEYVAASVSAISSFKGNTRSGDKLLHSKYQILSMVSSVMREMYPDKDYSSPAADWNEKKAVLSKNLQSYYVYDILTDYWNDGGANKIHSVTNSRRYFDEIPARVWNVALDAVFEKGMSLRETSHPKAPRAEDYVILNCIYSQTFSAMDQLSINKFDVEHIAPKKQLQKLIESCKGDGLPISCIANLCYLPEYVNRSKRDKNFYQDAKYLSVVPLDEIENKYSFTTISDLEWMDLDYVGHDDWEVLKEFYIGFCRSRFQVLKKRFFNAMNLDDSILSSQSVAEEQPGASDTILAKIEASGEIDFATTKVGPLAYYLVRKLFAENRISPEEKEELYTREFLRKANFKRVTYPVLAHTKFDNRSESPHIRYYATPILVNGEEVFVSHEWYEEAREALLKWYKSHY